MQINAIEIDAIAPPAERRAVPKPAGDPRGGWTRVPAGPGASSLSAERRAAPKPAGIPPGDRPMYPSDEGSS